MLDSYALEAAVYDRIFGSLKDYAGEVKNLREYIEQYKICDEPTLLDVGCGTGLHLEHWCHYFACHGVDISVPMLRHALENCNPKVTFSRGDMRDFTLARQFGVVTCLFSAIAHLLDVEDLRQAIVNMAEHVAPGGVLIVEPFFDPRDWQDGRGPILEYMEHAKIARVLTASRNDDIVTIKTKHFVNWAEGQGMAEYFEVRHKLALHPHLTYIDAFEAAGLQVVVNSPGFDGRGLFISVKPV